MIALIDIDGTLADNSHRMHYIEPPCQACIQWRLDAGQKRYLNCIECDNTGISKNGKDWDAFYEPERLLADKPVPLAQQTVPRFIKAKGNFVFFHTGRPERTRKTTVDWLRHHIWPDVLGEKLDAIAFIHGSPQLIMRKDGDHRHARVYKEELPKALAELHKDQLLFFDDDLRNRELYARYGLFFKAPECWECMP